MRFQALHMRRWGQSAVVAFGSLAAVTAQQRQAFNHCQVPCGIFSDGERFKAAFEDIRTIRKAQAESATLAKVNEAQALNQAVRWINTKEEHAARVIALLSDYVLCQRVKPPAGAAKEAQYSALLIVVHSAMRQAVLCKQSADPANADKLHELLSDVWSKYDAYANH